MAIRRWYRIVLPMGTHAAPSPPQLCGLCLPVDHRVLLRVRGLIDSSGHKRPQKVAPPLAACAWPRLWSWNEPFSCRVEMHRADLSGYPPLAKGSLLQVRQNAIEWRSLCRLITRASCLPS